jgi:pyocin large subunit-like protein
MFRTLFGLALAAITTAAAACGGGRQSTAERNTSQTASVAVQRPSTPATSVVRSAITRPNVGFRSRAQFNEHFQKHGAEFGRVTQQEYLRAAQTLRDAPAGGAIKELRRPDGTVSRFDRATGAFIAFNADGTIRTFFKPNDGEAYFRRQASRSH